MEGIELTRLESEVLHMLLAGEDSVLESLRQQLESAQITSRECYLSGHYLNFDVPGTHKRLHDVLHIKPDFCFGDVGAFLEAEENSQEVGFLLWIKDGLLDYLETYTYGFVKWPEIIDTFHLRYFDDPRDLDSLRQNWKL